MQKLPSYFIILASIFLFLGTKSYGKTVVHSVTNDEIKFLRAVDKRYQKEHGIHLKFKKTITVAMLGSKKNSEGEVWLDSGQMRLEIQKPEVSKIVAGKDYLWIESAPPPGAKGVKTQVMRASLSSDQAKSQGLIQLLTKGGVLKYFRVTGVQKSDEAIRYFLQPDKQSVEFKRAQILVNKATKEIRELKYWDQMDNETHYEFTESRFKQKLDNQLFNYTPPKEAEVIHY